MRVPTIAAMLVALSLPARSECLSSAEAVWNAHPGSHATWRLRLPGYEGVKCWFAKGSTNLQAPRVRPDLFVDSPRGKEPDRQTDGQAKRESSQVKASAADVPDETPARSESQQTLAPAERGPRSILVWGTPMRIDSTWEKLFAGRERRTQ
jgi:hypothetical protein